MSQPQLTTLQKVSSDRLGRLSWLKALADDIRQGALPAFILIALLVIAGLAEWQTGGPLAWGLSRQALSDGRWITLLTHAVAHGSPWHLFMNCSALIGLTVYLRPFLGFSLSGWARYGLVLAGAAGASAIAYILLHPSDGLPMVGASGAICGLWGLAVRCDTETRFVKSLRSRDVLIGIREFSISNLVLFGALFLLARLEGGAGGLAWEAHLGGFLFGLLAAPWLIKPAETTTVEAPAATS